MRFVDATSAIFNLLKASVECIGLSVAFCETAGTGSASAIDASLSLEGAVSISSFGPAKALWVAVK